jgi:peptidylglycine monooxygenase
VAATAQTTNRSKIRETDDPATLTISHPMTEGVHLTSPARPMALCSSSSEQDCDADGPGPAVVALSPDGRRISAWGGEEVADGHMLIFHPDGRIFVVDRDAHEITVFDRAGKRLRALGKHHCPGEPLNAPCDAAFASDGTIYVADGDGASVETSAKRA